MQQLEETGDHMNKIDIIRNFLGEEADHLLNFNQPKISKDELHL
jgi:hypothetical protein